MADRTRRTRATFAAIFVALVAATASAFALPAQYGPRTFERTPGPPDVFQDTFNVVLPGPHLLKLINGDDDGAQVNSVTIALNGVTVVAPSEVTEETISIGKAVTLVAGQNVLTVTLDGDEGSYVAIAIVGLLDKEPFITGRLILPYAGPDETVQLEVRNGSPKHPRDFRVLFLNPDGSVGADSGSQTIDARASFSSPSSAFSSAGSWTEGSIEIVYAGRASGKLFGQAVINDSSTGVTTRVNLQGGSTRSYLVLAGKEKKKK